MIPLVVGIATAVWVLIWLCAWLKLGAFVCPNCDGPVTVYTLIEYEGGQRSVPCLECQNGCGGYILCNGEWHRRWGAHGLRKHLKPAA